MSIYGTFIFTYNYLHSDDSTTFIFILTQVFIGNQAQKKKGQFHRDLEIVQNEQEFGGCPRVNLFEYNTVKFNSPTLLYLKGFTRGHSNKINSSHVGLVFQWSPRVMQTNQF